MAIAFAWIATYSEFTAVDQSIGDLWAIMTQPIPLRQIDESIDF